MGQGVAYPSSTGMPWWDLDTWVGQGAGHPSGTGTPQWHWEWDTLVGLGHSAGTETLALGYFSSTGILWWHRNTPMGLKHTLVGLGHYRGTLFGTGTLSLICLGGIGIHCRGNGTQW